MFWARAKLINIHKISCRVKTKPKTFIGVETTLIALDYVPPLTLRVLIVSSIEAGVTLATIAVRELPPIEF